MAPLLVLLTALAVVAGGLAFVLGGGNDDTSSAAGASTTTAPPASNAPTTEVQRQPGAVYFENSPGPVFKRPAQGALYLADGSRVKRIDLATGEITKSAAISLERSPEASQVVVVDGGLFVVYESGEVVAFDNDFNARPSISAPADSWWTPVWATRCGSPATTTATTAPPSNGTKPTSRARPVHRSNWLERRSPLPRSSAASSGKRPAVFSIGRSKSNARRYATGTLVGARGDTVVWFGCDDITGIDCRYNVGDGRDANKRQLDVVNAVSRPSASYLERLGTFPLSRDSIALPRSNDARLPLLNIETGTISTLSTGSSFFRALAMYWTTDGEWLLIHASKTVIRGVNARTGGVAEIMLPIESAGNIAVGAR